MKRMPCKRVKRSKQERAWGRLDINPVSTAVSQPQARQAMVAVVPMDWRTIFTTPAAKSPAVALSETLPKLAAVMSRGREGWLLRVRSPTVRSMRLMSPPAASFTICAYWLVPHSREQSPARVPPPTPEPHRWRTACPFSAQMKAVPVPMLTTTARSWPLRASPPAPTAVNSSTFWVGMP